MAIIVSAPDAFFDAEPWEFSLQINEPDGSGAIDLTGSRLFVRFASLADGVEVGTCDSDATNASLVIAPGVAGSAVFSLPSQGRSWRAPRTFPAALAQPTTVVGDLYRQAPGTTKWRPIGRIQFPVLPSTGLPTP